ncbi:TetR/AcrR family transcriptional regulator [Taklimakanibacter lacteus]|uniref:TetR/AcrR family transcriptional regulator n=1 Tax=Taklimakanibacter lacteus TaxID=2268456 RepID=UPI000E66C7D1
MPKDSTKTRQKLIAAADALFYNQGIRAVGVDAIALAAGVTKRTLYYHFKTKDDLIAAYLDGRDQPTLGRYQALLPKAGEPAALRVRRVFEHLAKSCQDRQWRGCSFLRAAAEFANLPGHPTRLIAARHKKSFEGWLADILRADAIADAAELARQIMILFDGAVAQILIHRDPGYAASAAEAAALLIRNADRRKWKSGARAG